MYPTYRSVKYTYTEIRAKMTPIMCYATPPTNNPIHPVYPRATSREYRDP